MKTIFNYVWSMKFSVVAIFIIGMLCAYRSFMLTKKSNTVVDDIVITTIESSKRRTVPTDLSKTSFGSVITDHMFVMEWSEGTGWSNAEIKPYAPFSADFACISLHYGPSIFEGMKAYKTGDGRITLFRPMENMARFNRSARRMCMPEIDPEFVMKALKLLIEQDKIWVPESPGTALYIRPTMMATETTINLKVANKFLFFIILSPVGSLYKEGFNPTSIMVSEQYTRASVGGVGDVKTAGNYAASMLAQQEAKHQGFSQVLWLDPIERKYVEEVGSMNIFFVMNNQLVTPALNGTILPGITRKSVIEIASAWGMDVVQRPISIDEVIEGIDNGQVTEIFGTGTAASIAPVGKLCYKGTMHIINNNQTGPVAQKFFNALTDIQYGKTKDLFGWIDYVC